ncbi:DNA cytosine methyltransferase [Halorussus aquaticus]|uniref:DNA (cytosine-5-)-methyltransferase n=1 Tax=Halorussus aquaticus TaxID=2953748 RepID=A0ABD5PY79_9EURY|nr:DNA cytosine methyltransferase [Halorussus aquaticus]
MTDAQCASETEREVVAVDLFCGAGGFSEGLRQACDDLGFPLREAAINHWDPAVQTHEANHPTAHQYHSKVEQLHPPEVIQRLSDDDTDLNVDLLVGGPECTHFSRARGGKPVSEQKRMSPWHVLDWLEKLDVDAFVIENVPEIQDWGPVEDGQPVRDGSIFDAWVNALNQLGYAVNWTQLVAADYGDPTTRERFFIIGRQAGSVTFPTQTHGDDRDDLPDRRTAAEIIDWSDLGGSIWTRDLDDGRKTPPKNSTMQRIAEGLRRHCSDAVAPFADVLETLGKDDIYRLREERVVPAAYASAVADIVKEPFLVPLPDSPAVMSATHLLRQQDGAHPLDVEESPVPTIATRGGHAIVTTETRSLVMPRNGPRGDLHSNTLYPPEDRPLHTVTASNHDGHLLTPSLVRYSNGGAALNVADPMPTMATEKGGVVTPSSPVLRPFIDDYEGPPKSPYQLLGTITSRDRFALCIPKLWPWGLDVQYRMLQPRELKQAQGFPADYELVGTKTDRTEQIGNAVPVNLAKNLCKHVLTAEDPSLATFGGGLADEPDADIPSYEEVASDD